MNTTQNPKLGSAYQEAKDEYLKASEEEKSAHLLRLNDLWGTDAEARDFFETLSRY